MLENPKQAKALMARAIERAQRDAGDDLLLAKALMTQAQAQCQLGEIGESLASLELGLNLFFGNVYSRVGEFSTALTRYYESLALRQELNDESNSFTCLNNIGLTLQKQNLFDDALETFQKRLAIATKQNQARRSLTVHQNIGVVYARLLRSQEATECFEKALAIAESLNQAHLQAGLLNNLGNVAMNSGNYDKAFPFFQKSIEVSAKLDDKFGLVEAFVSIGICVARMQAKTERLSS